MDSNITMENPIVQGVVSGFIYDIGSLLGAFLLYKVIYEWFYIDWKWGYWNVHIVDESGEEVVNRPISTQAAKRIFDDQGDFATYIKGIISPYAQINIDIVSQKAKDIGLIEVDTLRKDINIDLSKNPPRKS